MTLDRDSIERRDFPVGRRGYEQAVVDAHLAAVAAEVEELRRRPPQATETLAGQAGEQVRAILEAAERAAGDMRRRAEEDVGALRQEATGDARDYLAEVSQGSQALSERIGAIQRELTALFDELKEGANRVGADLRLLESGVAGLGGAAGVAAAAESPPPPTTAGADADPPREEENAAVGEPIQGAAPTAPSSGGEDGEGARIVALDMALNGSSREETGRYLAEHYALADADALLDEVYATVGS